jgi:hypothetical protein
LWSARYPFATCLREDGWTIIAASIPRKTPSSTIRAFPYPVSSAGVPSAITFPDRNILCRIPRARGGARRRHADDVVTARVAQGRQRVHLAEERGGRLPPSEHVLRAEGGLHPRDAPADAEPLRREEIAQRPGGPGFLEGKFGERRDVPEHPDRVGGQRLGDHQYFFSRRVHGSWHAPRLRPYILSHP